MEVSAARQKFIERVVKEADVARQEFPKFHSTHEAFAVILEELEEYWDCVRGNCSMKERYIEELVQVAAMCLCAAEELHA